MKYKKRESQTTHTQYCFLSIFFPSIEIKKKEQQQNETKLLFDNKIKRESKLEFFLLLQVEIIFNSFHSLSQSNKFFSLHTLFLRLFLLYYMLCFFLQKLRCM